jgi:DNA-binding MarR family transcriptional regulator
MTDSDLDRSLGFLLHDIARMLRKRFDQRVRHLGMTRAQWQLLSHLARHEGINQSGLADILEIEPITLARLVDRMVEAGWVERRAHPSDRRQRCLYLTARARPRFADLRKVAAEIFEDVLADFSTAERDDLLDMLVRVRRALSGSRQSSEMEPIDTAEAESLAVRRSGTIIAALGDERP